MQSSLTLVWEGTFGAAFERLADPICPTIAWLLCPAGHRRRVTVIDIAIGGNSLYADVEIRLILNGAVVLTYHRDTATSPVNLDVELPEIGPADRLEAWCSDDSGSTRRVSVTFTFTDREA